MRDNFGVCGRRAFLGGVSGATMAAFSPSLAAIKHDALNLALVAKVMVSSRTSKAERESLNSGYTPQSSSDSSRDALRFWEPPAPQWIEYSWSKPVTIDQAEIYWHAAGSWLYLPKSYRILTWNGQAFEAVVATKGQEVAKDSFNITKFKPVKTTRIRLEVTPDGKKSFALLQWRVLGQASDLPPLLDAGLDRTLVVGASTYLQGKARWLSEGPGHAVLWAQKSGPSKLAFADPASAETTASATTPGAYELQLAAHDGKGLATSTVRVKVEEPPPPQRLDVVYTTPYSIDSPFWKARTKAMIVNWIPHCIAYCERTDLKIGEGGLDNFIEAAKALRGEPHAKHKGYVFSNAWVHQTVESMCIALMVDAGGDPEILAAQKNMRATLEKWIPIILSAQHPDGYLQTAYTLADRKEWPARWSPEQRGNHEGYVSGYFIESAINHYTLTDGKDLRLYNAAKKLADCWVANIGPGKKAWFDGHQEMEQALVRFGRFVNDMEGKGKGDAYIQLARFLLESRQGGSEYDQSHRPPQQQYEAVGHAVRATYFYSGMADIAAETHDRDYQSAVKSLWDNMVNRKYYVTGGIGSGDTSEGFGDNYVLSNDAYCESCSSCGLIFFQYKLNLAYHDARYADLYEETMYNALLGSIDLKGEHFTYTNPLEDRHPRYKWHVCPCCVGNIPRTLLMVPTWTYVKGEDGIYVNLFVGSKIDVGAVAGTRLQMVQETNYPWEGAVAITVNPEKPAEFAVRIRVPNRKTSALYELAPSVGGMKAVAVNGVATPVKIENGYAVIVRRWKKGDKIELELPLAVQTVKADARIEATRGKVALKYGPMVYNVETADQPRIDGAIGTAPLTATWRADLLGGVMAISGNWQDGSPLTAIPNYARMNRAGPGGEYPPEHETGPILSQVWVKGA
ncbi:hypothetical protein FHS83_003174 [Rhizomicrobium palustre]|uniref:Tat pathway signal protein n=1 Tax=Rhizomicrobium palustre TaxID=189966 RepID=A0A846N292_9PROT|nr:beta-L-arabinofuranosidase domain-containing protein [Rhizomicrobium palustre]NIK89856.1 hypothetical protein [Rhizomicrobium palustre]